MNGLGPHVEVLPEIRAKLDEIFRRHNGSFVHIMRRGGFIELLGRELVSRWNPESVPSTKTGLFAKEIEAAHARWYAAGQPMCWVRRKK